MNDELKVTIYYSWELDKVSEAHKEYIEPPYSRYDYYSYMVIDWPNGDVQVETDHMEPEDASFNRDLKWVKKAIERAYRHE